MSIEPRKAIPIIGMVSSGKSTFLNSLLGIDVLETKDDITTKFACVIRHNPNLKEPRFYHLKLIRNKLDSDDYNFHKDGNEIIGEVKIKEKISKINSDELLLESKYENLFYMLETKIINIDNNEFLKKYDFYDIPGLNEKLNITNEELLKIKEENKNNEKKKGKSIHHNFFEQEMRYINKLFPYFKSKIDFGIILIDTENYYYPSNINIIKNIYNILSKRIKNYMFILNKIDKSENPIETVKKCKAFFTNYIDSSIFRISDNFFQEINSIQFKNEMNMKYNYENYYLYFLNEYCKYSNSNKDPISFLDFLYGKITEKSADEDKEEKIESLAKNIDDSQFKEIKEIYEKTKNGTNMNINYGFDFNDDESINILKSFYKTFLDKSLITPYSEDVKNILYFFTNFNFETNEPKQKAIKELNKDKFLMKLSKQEKIINNFIKVFHELKKYTNNKDGNIIVRLQKDLEELKIIVLNQKRIYIPLIGVSSSGKSTILNNIVGYKIFPESKEECTTRGIIVQHSFDGTSKLYEITIDSLIQNKDFYIFKENPNINPIEGRDKITSFLESVNEKYSLDEKTQFYILKTPIEFFNEYNINDDLKRRISFIDLPGSNTLNNAFNFKQEELTAYEKILRVCTSFLFVNKGAALKLIENEEILNSTYYSILRNSKIKNNNIFLRNCSFVINMFSILKEEEKNIENVKTGICDMIFGKKELSKNVNAAYFNAKQYSEFLKYKNYYNNINSIFLNLKEGYNKQFNFLYSYTKKEKNFPKYCLKILNKELENLSLKNDQDFKCGEEFKIIIENKIKDIMAELSQPIKANDVKTIIKVANILKFIQNNIKEIIFYKNSNSKDFFDKIIVQIKNSESYIEKEYSDYLRNTLEKFESFFRVSPDKRNTLAQKQFDDLSCNISSDLINLFENFHFEENFNLTKYDIENFLNDKLKELKQILRENKNNVKQSLSAIIEDITENNINKLSSILRDKLIKLINEFTKLKNDVREKGKEINIKNNIENSSFLDDLENIKINNALERHFGIRDIMKIDNDELLDIIIEVQGFFNIIKHFFKYVFRKDKELKDDILELKNKILEKINSEQKSFTINYENMQKEIIDNFAYLFLTQSSDLSRITKEDYTNALNLYIETKIILVEDKSGREEEKGLKNENKNMLVDNENKNNYFDNKEKEINELINIFAHNLSNIIDNISYFLNELLD